MTWTPDCFLDGTAPPFQIQLGFRVRLGAAPTPYANGLYWISVYVHGKRIDAPSWTPGTAVDYSVAVQQDLGLPVLIRANAYLPIKKIQSNDQHEFNFPEMCEGSSGTIYVPATSNAKTASGLYVTDETPYLTIASSGEIDLIHNHPTRPPAIFNAPAQLEIYVGGVLVVSNANLNNALMTARGEVFARIKDTRHSDNAGGYSVTISVRPARGF